MSVVSKPPHLGHFVTTAQTDQDPCLSNIHSTVFLLPSMRPALTYPSGSWTLGISDAFWRLSYSASCCNVSGIPDSAPQRVPRLVLLRCPSLPVCPAIIAQPVWSPPTMFSLHRAEGRHPPAWRMLWVWPPPAFSCYLFCCFFLPTFIGAKVPCPLSLLIWAAASVVPLAGCLVVWIYFLSPISLTPLYF